MAEKSGRQMAELNQILKYKNPSSTSASTMEDPIPNWSINVEDGVDLRRWELTFFVNENVNLPFFESQIFNAVLTFPENYPMSPPKLVFTSPIYHPNVYASTGEPGEDRTGEVCISILHPPGEDQFNEQESADERWRPVLSVEKILLSVQVMMGNPNYDSPANVNASKDYREYFRPGDYVDVDEKGHVVFTSDEVRTKVEAYFKRQKKDLAKIQQEPDGLRKITKAIKAAAGRRIKREAQID